MSAFIANYIEGQARKHVQGGVSDALNPQQKYKTDPEVLALQEEAAQSSKRFWWKRQAKPDIILSKRDRRVLRAVKRRAIFLDKGFNCCCFTFGFDFLIGLIPGIGDFVGMLLGFDLIRVACEAELPKHIQVQMVTNVLIDFVVGLTPIVGDIMDAVIKCNWRNALILEDYLMLRRRDEIRAERGLLPAQGESSSSAQAKIKAKSKTSPPAPQAATIGKTSAVKSKTSPSPPPYTAHSNSNGNTPPPKSSSSYQSIPKSTQSDRH
ncbi:hypothetical protein BC940DRAFT_236474 [Gongronella butleri]|nr:hypothetical protein BC940DRAFT_236474 [Gongronella butleri]